MYAGTYHRLENQIILNASGLHFQQVPKILILPSHTHKLAKKLNIMLITVYMWVYTTMFHIYNDNRPSV
jgi:hypothetical protein